MGFKIVQFIFRFIPLRVSHKVCKLIFGNVYHSCERLEGNVYHTTIRTSRFGIIHKTTTNETIYGK